jgi:hypothetical protein
LAFDVGDEMKIMILEDKAVMYMWQEEMEEVQQVTVGLGSV